MTIKQRLEKTKTEIITKYRNGVPTTVLGQEYNCSNASIWVCLKEWGEPLRQTTNKFDELIPEVRRQLDMGLSVGQVAKSTGIPQTSLNRIAKKLGYDTSQYIKRCKVNLNEHSEEIIQLYQSGKSQSQIAEQIGCDESNISRLLTRNGIETRFHYSVDHHFFSRIDTEEKAYTLGFFTADGSNHSKNNTISIDICDLDVLEQIKIAMQYNGSISIHEPPKKFLHRQKHYRLTIGSQQLSKDLFNKGCPPKKTFLTRCPTEEEVSTKLIRHYTRGLFDGDGSVFKTTNGWHICIAGTTALLDPLRHKVHCQCGVMLGLYPHGKIYVAKIGGNNQVRQFLDWLYADATIYMERKHARYRELLGAGSNTLPLIAG